MNQYYESLCDGMVTSHPELNTEQAHIIFKRMLDVGLLEDIGVEDMASCFEEEIKGYVLPLLKAASSNVVIQGPATIRFSPTADEPA